jgi:3-deoxy-D-manno-octulosonic-acid transferase
MILYSVFLRLISGLLIFIPQVRKRLSFERRNFSDATASKFSIPADLAFEFSSEGEFQQVLPLITDALNAGKRIELIYFSPSVERGVRELCEKHPEQLRSLRYPFLTGGILNWITSRKLILVRYDLFPEFLSYTGELLMVWVSFKKERSRGKSVSGWKKEFLKRATTIIYATTEDARTGKELGFPGEAFDFRIEQIHRRLESKEEKFQSIFPEYKTLDFEKFPREKRLIVGNAWPSDLILLADLPEDIYILVVPHKLEPEIISAFEKHLGKKAVVLSKKGVLCELYADFGYAYVGGGFETSIHSVLEPLISGADQISCGPLHHRSTEFDIAVSQGNMTVVKNSQEFNLWLNSYLVPVAGDGKMNSLSSGYPKYREAIISC